MNKKHLTRFAAMATIALMGSTAAWAATGANVEGNKLDLLSGGSTNVSIEENEFSTSTIQRIQVVRGAGAATISTLMLPVTVKVTDAVETAPDEKIVKAYSPTTYSVNEKRMDFVSVETIEANKPYLVEVSGHPSFFEFQTTTSYKIEATGNNEHSVTLPNSCWEFTGTYNTHTWVTSPGNVYGYDAADGKFVKAGNNVTIYPMRAYLTCTKAQAVKGLGKVASEESLPDVINVRFVDKDGGTLSIGKMNTRTGEIQMQDRYYDLKGRKLNAKPQNKMMYVNKKVIKH
jgi:hypothetical protein